MLLLGYHWFSDLVAGLAAGVLLLGASHGIDAVSYRRSGSRLERHPVGS